MVRKLAPMLRCPICRNAVKSTDPEFPFCSDRCRTIDLGKWASGAYVIPSPLTDADEQFGTADSGDSENSDSEEHGKSGN
jgi:uncharacterized protein